MVDSHDYLGSCRDCRFWYGYVNEESNLPDYGFCNRYPPAPITQGQLREIPQNLDMLSKEYADFLMDWKTRSISLFSRPVTEAEDFCGEWKSSKY